MRSSPSFPAYAIRRRCALSLFAALSLGCGSRSEPAAATASETSSSPGPAAPTPAAPSAPAEPTEPTEVTILGARTFTELEIAAIAVEVPSPERDLLRLARVEGGYQLLVGPSALENEIGRLASFTRQPVSGKQPFTGSYLSVQRVRLRGRALRTERTGGAPVAALEGTFGTAFLGFLPGGESSRTRPADPVYVILTGETVGWVDSRDLAAYDACVPTRELVATALRGETEDSLKSATIGHVPAEGRYARQRPYYVVRKAGDSALFSFLTHDARCGSTWSQYTVRFPGIEDVRFGMEASLPLIALGAPFDETFTRWHFLRPAVGEDIFLRDLATRPVIPPERRDRLELGPRRAESLERNQVKMTLSDGRTATYAYSREGDSYELVAGDETVGGLHASALEDAENPSEAP